jgi:hypothetical protein
MLDRSRMHLRWCNWVQRFKRAPQRTSILSAE